VTVATCRAAASTSRIASASSGASQPRLGQREEAFGVEDLVAAARHLLPPEAQAGAVAIERAETPDHAARGLDVLGGQCGLGVAVERVEPAQPGKRRKFPQRR
jgi:hypothetical protein